MNHWLDHRWQQLQLGEALMTGSVDALLQGFQAPTAEVLGRLRTGAERWQAAIRKMQTPINLADILRARTLI
jgi:hypothetical protein